MNKPHWNRIEFDYWERGQLSMHVNNFGEGPIILELEDDTHDLWMTPREAREVAAKLIEAANAAELAGPYVDQQFPKMEG